jgi:hypothetical protein
MRALLLATLVVVAACREPLPPPTAPVDGGADLAMPALPPVDCRTAADCLACCTGELQSGALDFTAAVQSCACQAASCQSACKQTICGAALGVDAPCRACLDGTLVDGGACQTPVRECVATSGGCGAWQTCVERCP